MDTKFWRTILNDRIRKQDVGEKRWRFLITVNIYLWKSLKNDGMTLSHEINDIRSNSMFV